MGPAQAQALRTVWQSHMQVPTGIIRVSLEGKQGQSHEADLSTGGRSVLLDAAKAANPCAGPQSCSPKLATTN